MSENFFEKYTNRGFQLTQALAVACASMLATERTVKVNDKLTLQRTELPNNERSYNISWYNGHELLSLVVKPIQKDDGLRCIVIRAAQEDLKTGDFRVIHNINSHVPHENGKELKARFGDALASLLEKHQNKEISRPSGREA